MKKLLTLAMLVTASVAAAAPGAVQERTLVTRGPVIALAADGDRAALIIRVLGHCASVSVWEPSRGRVVQLPLRLPCASDHNGLPEGVALAGTRVAWLSKGFGNGIETVVSTETLARRRPVWVGWGYAPFAGTFARRPVGDGTLLAFTVEQTCEDNGGSESPCPPGRKTGDIVAATVWRVAGRGQCPGTNTAQCSRVAQADGELSVLAVDAGRIAVRTESGVQLLTAGGNVLQEFDLRARSAALSGNRLAVRTADAVEVYDASSGRLTARFPAASHLRLEDLDRGILVTALGRTVTLRRLGDGRTTTIRTSAIARAQLERPGLFVAAGRRVTFARMQDVLRMLGAKGQRR